MSAYNPKYDVTLGDVRMIVNPTPKIAMTASVELTTGAAFDGTTTTARLLQSNDKDSDIDNWAHLPEDPLVLVTGAGVSLLQTVSFTCKYLAVEIIQGDATAGVINVTEQFNG